MCLHENNDNIHDKIKIITQFIFTTASSNSQMKFPDTRAVSTPAVSYHNPNRSNRHNCFISSAMIFKDSCPRGLQSGNCRLLHFLRAGKRKEKRGGRDKYIYIHYRFGEHEIHYFKGRKTAKKNHSKRVSIHMKNIND